MALEHKYRPNTLAEVKGNNEVVQALEVMLTRERERIPHVFLFTGDKGCGKTTLGRITSNMLGCAGRDFKEMDSAQDRGIDGIRSLREKMTYSPMEGKCLVWLIDECHKLTNDAQNALLKSLEDCPDHVYFILCTTDPDKLIAPVLSRCKAGSFKVKPLADFEMEEHLRNVARMERKRVHIDAIRAISKRCEGSSRNALGMLDKIIDLDIDAQTAMVEKEEEKEVLIKEFCQALLKRADWDKVADMLNNLFENEQDPEDIRRAIMGYASKVMLNVKSGESAVAASAFLLLDCFKTPTYANGKAQIVLSAYDALQG